VNGWVWIALAALLAAYVLAVLALLLAGRRSDARAVAGFVPDCARLFWRLAGDPRVSRRHKALLLLAAGYLAMPIDLVPDFIPVAGQLDDAIIVALVLRSLVRAAGPDVVTAHWPGPRSSLTAVLRLAAAA
jgi:uncharacterized membrane protein YkvA (DUF1232 family)